RFRVWAAQTPTTGATRSGRNGGRFWLQIRPISRHARNHSPRGDRRSANGLSGFGVSILYKWIGWIPSVDETGTADSQKSFHLLDRLGDHAVRLAGLKLALELNEGAISAVEPPC